MRLIHIAVLLGKIGKFPGKRKWNQKLSANFLAIAGIFRYTAEKQEDFMADPKLPPQPPRQPMQQMQPQQLNISIDEAVGEGIYSNLVLIAHTAAEFVMDFARVMPGVPKAKVQSRIIMTPQHLKGFVKALQENVQLYENRFGEIKVEGLQQEGRDIGFRRTDTQ
jgi:hypothetical protein